MQADEAWTFVHTKQKRLSPRSPAEWGDQYVWLALDSEAKLIMSWRVGKRDGLNAYEFMQDLRGRIANRCQLTTDGLDGYIDAVEEHFGTDVDFAQLVKQYAPPNTKGPDWFRPSSHVVAAIPTPITGNPKMERISTSHIEQSDRADAPSPVYAADEWFLKKAGEPEGGRGGIRRGYNVCPVHQTLRVTPAMEAGITDHVWTIGELLAA